MLGTQVKGLSNLETQMLTIEANHYHLLGCRSSRYSLYFEISEDWITLVIKYSDEFCGKVSGVSSY